MSVILYEPNIELMLQSRTGPVGIFTGIITERAKNRAVERAQQIMHRFPGGAASVVDGRIFEAPLRGEVGMFEPGRISQYLIDKERREKWLTQAVLGGE